MASKPTHYRMTVNRPFEHAGARFRPGGRYTVKASVYDAIKKERPEAIATADPLNMG